MEEPIQPLVVEENQRYRRWARTRAVVLDYTQARRELLGRGWPERYLSASWDAVDARTRTLTQEGVKKEFFTGQPYPRGLLIYGNIGVGKSSLMGLVALYLVRAFQIDVRFIHAGALFDAFFEDASVREYMSCDVLCIDDLGQEYRSDYAVSRFTRIFEHRYANLMTTFVTTQRSVEEMRALPGFRHIGDRLNDPTWLLHLKYAGDSRRVRSQK